MTKRLTVCFVGLLLTLPLLGGIPLARQGSAAAEILIDADAHPAVQYAAAEFQHWVEEISGAKLPIVTAPGGAAHRLLFADATTSAHFRALASSYDDDIARLQGKDGYAIRNDGSHAVVFAACPRGVLNGAYRVLYKNSDIIWARPHPGYGAVFSRNPDLELRWADYRDIPSFRMRGWQFNSAPKHDSNTLWQIRNGSNWINHLTYDQDLLKYGTFFEYGGGHNLVGLYMPEAKYFEKHPEFYPWKDGQRLRPGDYRHRTQLCFSNPECYAAFEKEFASHVAANPDYDTYRVLIEDNYLLCECEACQQPVPAADGGMVAFGDKDFYSTQFFVWLNKLARWLRLEHPGKNLATYAYFFTEVPPRVKVEDNINVILCAIYKDSRASLENRKNIESDDRFLGWAKISNRIIWRDYYGLYEAYPRPMDIVCLADLRYLHDRGCDQTYTEMIRDADVADAPGDNSWSLNAMYFWVMTEGNWNPFQDVKELRRDYLERTFGPAAADVGEFYAITERGWFASNAKSRYNDRSQACWRSGVVNLGQAEACQAALARAAAKAVHPNARKMLASMRATVDAQLASCQPFGYAAVRAATRPALVARLDGGGWEKAAASDQFLERSSAAPIMATTVKVLYDHDNLYIGARCEDKTMARTSSAPAGSPRDVWREVDKFEIFLTGRDSGNAPTYYQIAVDMNGNIYDARQFDKTWNGDVDVQTAKDQDGWSALVTVPFKTLNMTPALALEKGLKTLFLRYRYVDKIKAETLFWHGGGAHNPDDFGDLKLQP